MLRSEGDLSSRSSFVVQGREISLRADKLVEDGAGATAVAG